MKLVFARIYGVLASLRLTIVVLSVLAAALIYGTFYESANGTPMAHHSVYASKWFDFILVVLFVNMVACTAKRYPYKPHQLGFLMVHCGILTILTGAMLTRNYGREGELFVNEGETRDFMTSTRPFLRVDVPQDGVAGHEVQVVFPAKATGADVDRELRVPRSPVRLRVTRYFPNARWRDTVAEGEHDNPGLRIAWSLHDTPGEAWLLPREAGRAAVEAPVRIEAVEVRDPDAADSLLAVLAPQEPDTRGTLRLQSGQQALATIPIDGDLPRSVRAGPYSVNLRQWYSDFRIQDGAPVNASAAMANPALVFDVEGPRGIENHVVFAFHEMRSLLAPQDGLGYDIAADYVYQGGPDTAPRVVLLRTPGGEWRLASNFDLDVPADHKLEVQHTYRSAAADFELTVQEVLDRAESQSELYNVDRQEQNPAVFIQAESSGGSSPAEWLVYGDTRTVQAGDRQVTLQLTKRQMPLGFGVQLVDFVETTYPGTNRSATFASDVLVDDGGGSPVPIHISMNKPLKHRGFRLFQSSFVRNGGQEASVFSVTYDPGVSVVYTGFIIFIAGLVVIFYLKPVIRRAYLRSLAPERSST